MPPNPMAQLSSSPDPLSASLTYSTPAKTTIRRRSSITLHGSSPRKQTFELDVGNQISPQKIRVTVEAGSSTAENNRRGGSDIFSQLSYYVPTMRPNERTRTTTIPVKGLSDSEDEHPGPVTATPKRGRGRPRKSTGTPIPPNSKRLSVTPAKKNPRRRTLGDLVDGDDDEDWDFVIGAGVEIGRGKGRSRSRSLKSVSRNKDTPSAKPKSSPEMSVSSTTGKNGRARRKSLLPEEVHVLEDAECWLPAANKENETIDVEDSVLSVIDVNAIRLPQTTTFQSKLKETEEFAFWRNPDLIKLSPADRSPSELAETTPCVAPASRLPSRISVSDPSNENQRQPGLSHNKSDIREYMPVLNNQQHPSNREENLCYEIDEEARDDQGVFPEFDTILESEGFSMISVDSVPSLRQHLSSPPGYNGLEAIQSSALNKMLLSVRKEAVAEDSFSSIAPEIFEAATPGRKLVNQSILSIRGTHLRSFNDSFSSIQPEILEAISPRSSLPKNKFLAVREMKHGVGDDSFSSIPSAILEAATPAKQRKAKVELNKQSLANSDLTAGHSELFIPKETSSRSPIQREKSSRLLTPDETPSPEIENREQKSINSIHAWRPMVKIPEHLPDGSSILASQMQSSPPVLVPQRNSQRAHFHHDHPQLSAKDETPSIVFSSPALPPLKQRPASIAPPASRLTSDRSKGQSISPIVRAGRALQDIIVPVISSTSSASLKSPFKSPVENGKSAVNDRLQASRNPSDLEMSSEVQNRNPVRIGDIFAGFSNDARSRLSKTSPSRPDEALHGEDPFTTNDPGQHGLQSREQERGSSFERLGVENAFNSHPIGTANCNDVEIYSEDETNMSVNDQTPQIISLNEFNNSETELLPRASRFRHNDNQKGYDIGETTEFRKRRLEREWAAERAAVSQQIELASTSQVIVIGSDVSFSRTWDDINKENKSEEGPGEDIWLAEATHSSSFATDTSEHMSEEGPMQKPRRRKIPNMRTTKNTKIFINSGQPVQTSPYVPSIKDVLEPGHTDKTHPAPKMISLNSASSDPVIVQAAARTENMSDLSAIWHIPQKSNFTPRPLHHRETGKLDLSAFFGSSPVKPQTTSQAPSVLSSASHRILSSPSFEQAPEVTFRGYDADLPTNQSLDTSVVESFPATSSDLQENQHGIHNDLVGSGEYKEGHISEPPNFGESLIVEDGVHAPIQLALLPGTPTDLASPRKSCLRTPSATTPSKTVIFAAENPSPLPPSPVLSSTTWTKAHWKLLDSIYQDSKTPEPPKSDEENSENDSVSAELPDDMKQALRSKYLGKKISAGGTSLRLEVWHLQIVALFREQVQGWDEGVIAKRVFAIIVGEERRQQNAKK